MLKRLLLRRYQSGLRDFASMGHGIECRYERCRGWWDAHLRCSREFVAGALPRCDNLLVIGAGRLLDVDLNLLRERSKTVTLLDADPSCYAVWARHAGDSFGNTVYGRIGDCTDVLEDWTRGLSLALAGNSLGTYLHACGAPLPAWSRDSFDGIISLNILGQIPLYWRDRVRAAKFSLDDREQLGLVASMGELQRAHLEGLLAQNTAWSIVLTDTEYYFYHVDRSEWRVEPALFEPCAEIVRDSYNVAARSECWFWHVSPQYVECDDEGEIHKVEAFFKPAAHPKMEGR